MDLSQDTYHFLNRRTVLLSALTALSLVMASSGVATAQQENYVDFSHPNVTIDLSVIDNGGYQSATGAGATVSGGSTNLKLLMPGSRAPTSMLHVPTASGKPLSLPKIKAKKNKVVQAVAKAPVPVIKEAPAPMPVKTVVSPKKLEAPAKPAMPVVPAPTIKSEQKMPPSAPVVAPAAKVAEKIAPKAAPPAPPTPTTQKAAAPQQASRPPTTMTLDPGLVLRVAFGPKQTKLPASSKDELVALAENMKGRKNIRLQLMAYAGGPSLSSSLARRMSLSRALSIRSFLIESGVRSTRIDVRALGNKTTEEPINRVDLNVAER